VQLPSDVGDMVDREIAAILEAQTGDGSFTAWPGAPSVPGGSVWRTTYALWALNVANLHEHKVPSDAMTRALGFVRDSLVTWDKTPRDRAEAAFGLDVLADLGFGDIDKMEALFQARAHLPLFARALLAHAMTVAQMEPSEVDDLLGDAENYLRTTPQGATVVDEAGPEYEAFHDSSARSTAMVLRALVARAKAKAPNVFKKIRPPELVSRVARGLLAQRKGGAWRTPEETIWSLRALEDYRAAHERNAPDADGFFYLNGVELLAVPMHDRKQWQSASSFGMRKVFGAHASGGVLGFRVKGSGTLRYEARLRYAPAEPPPQGIDSGFALSRRVTRLDSAPSGAKSASNGFRSGDRVQVDLLVVTSSPRDHVVIEDPLPGGLVAARENRSLPDGEPRVEVQEDRVVVSFEHLAAGVSHVRYLARAGLPGRYVFPPTRATCRYEPEVFGQSAADFLEVSP
jgi:alpha-2-macroglobulin